MEIFLINFFGYREKVAGKSAGNSRKGGKVGKGSVSGGWKLLVIAQQGLNF